MKKPFTLLIVLGAHLALAQTPPSAPSWPLSSQTGRFACGRITESNRDVCMLDTQTGRLWQVAWDKDGQMSLKPVMYRRDDGSLSAFPDEDLKKFVKPLYKGEKPVDLPPGLFEGAGKMPAKPLHKLEKPADPSLPPPGTPSPKEGAPPKIRER